MNQQTVNAVFLALIQNTAAGFQKQISNAGSKGWADAIRSAQQDEWAVKALRLARRMICQDDQKWEAPARHHCLSSVFTHMNGYHPNAYLPVQPAYGRLRMPQPVPPKDGTDAEIHTLWHQLQSEAGHVQCSEQRIQPLLQALEKWSSCIPSNLSDGAEADISLYDESKLLAAIASCVSEDLGENAGDWEQEPSTHWAERPLFLLYSADFSGIQKFIYTVSTANALRTLRSRSFVLELLLEHFLDELLTACGVSRCNLLYTGGGHCYALLPNTPRSVEVCSQWSQRMNDWLRRHFGSLLYLAAGWTACSANELNDLPAEQQRYQAVFQRLSSAIAAQKLHRYSAAQLLALNRRNAERKGRECRICGNTEHLSGDVCPVCGFFERVSRDIQTRNLIAISEAPLSEVSLSIPAADNEVCLQFVGRGALERGKGIRRVYQKKNAGSPWDEAVLLSVGDYSAGNQMSDFSAGAEGIPRIAVCRMDVDNLGHAFVAGFSSLDGSSRIVSLMRTSAFSRQLSLFFKQYINDILSGQYLKRRPLKVSIVYSGGDDVFLVGTWSDVIQAAQRIQEAFDCFSSGSLTISGGIGLFHDHYPIRMAAVETGALEDNAKSHPDKNALALFQADGSHTYGWSEFREHVMGEKRKLLRQFFSGKNDRGNTFLYHLLQLLRQSSKDRLNLARFAYLLSKMEPSKRDPRHQEYRSFAEQMYRWAVQPEQRRELITAINIFVYENRKKG